jgi:predicted benzoate:H+ symporter BenE
MNEQGLVLMGKAAEQYVTFKYVELFIMSGFVLFIIGVIGFIFYAIIREER